MASNRWLKLFDEIKFIGSKPDSRRLTTLISIESIQSSTGFVLPPSYCEFASLFGPGDLANMFRITAPLNLNINAKYDLKRLNKNFRISKSNEIIDEFYDDPNQIKRLVFFATNYCTNRYAWDPKTVQPGSEPEYSVYLLRHAVVSTELLATSFSEFIESVCLDVGGGKIFSDWDGIGNSSGPLKVFKSASAV